MKKTILTLSLYFFLLAQSCATDFYWVGGSGNWTDLNHWATTSGGVIHPIAVPGTGDDVFFDANSFTAVSQKVTLTADAVCRSMSWTGVTNNPAFEFAGSVERTMKIYGSLTLVSGMSVSYVPNDNGIWEFWSGSTGNTITTAGKQLHNARFLGAGGGWTLQDNLNANQQIAFNYGTLNTNNVTVNTGSFYILSGCGGCSPININLSSSIINCTTEWIIYGNVNLTLNTGTSVISCPSFRSVGNFTYHNVEMNGSGINPVELNGTTLFNNFDFIAGTALDFSSSALGDGFTVTNRLGLNRPGSTITFSAGSLIVANGILELPNPGAGCSAFTTLKSSISGNAATISKSSGNIVSSRMAIKDITAAGGATFTANQSINQGGNSGWIINAAPTSSYFWIGGSGNWNDGNHWSASSGGAASGCIPSLNDDVFFNANSFTAVSQKVTLTADAVCRSMSWTGVTNNPAFEFAGSVERTMKIYGSLTLVSGMSVSYVPNDNGIWEFWSGSTGNTITTAGKQLHNARFLGAGGGWTLQDNLNANQQIAFNYGTLNTNNVTVNTGSFYILSGCGGCSPININLGSSIINCTTEWIIYGNVNLTLNTGTSVINTPSFISAGKSYNNVILNGSAGIPALNASLDIFNNLTISTSVNTNFNGIDPITINNAFTINGPAKTIAINPFMQINLNGTFAVNSSATEIISIESSSNGVQGIFNKSSGRVCISDVILKDLNATGGANFYASNSTNNGNNSGWNFTSQTCLVILPVQLLSFDLACAFDKIVFNWKTASEINSSHFEIQKQINTGWITIGKVIASGNSQSERTYRFQSTEEGGVYRLVSVDVDEKTSYSKVITTRNCKENLVPNSLAIYPNPANGIINFLFNGDIGQVRSIAVFNMLGERVYYSGRYQSYIDLTSKSNGIYFVHFNLFNKTITAKIIIER